MAELRVGFAAVIRRLAVLAGALAAATSLSSCSTFQESGTAAVVNVQALGNS